MLAALVTIAALAPQHEHPLLWQAYANCPLNANPDAAVLYRLFEIEEAFEFPEHARGLLSAAACHESAYRVDPGRGDRGRSVGMFQWQAWAKSRIELGALTVPEDDPRLDWQAAAMFWASHYKRQIGFVERSCKKLNGYAVMEEMLAASAALTAVRPPICTKRLGQKCVRFKPWCAIKGRLETRHWKRLSVWKNANSGV